MSRFFKEAEEKSGKINEQFSRAMSDVFSDDFEFTENDVKDMNRIIEENDLQTKEDFLEYINEQMSLQQEESNEDVMRKSNWASRGLVALSLFTMLTFGAYGGATAVANYRNSNNETAIVQELNESKGAIKEVLINEGKMTSEIKDGEEVIELAFPENAEEWAVFLGGAVDYTGDNLDDLKDYLEERNEREREREIEEAAMGEQSTVAVGDPPEGYSNLKDQYTIVYNPDTNEYHFSDGENILLDPKEMDEIKENSNEENSLSDEAEEIIQDDTVNDDYNDVDDDQDDTVNDDYDDVDDNQDDTVNDDYNDVDDNQDDTVNGDYNDVDDNQDDTVNDDYNDVDDNQDDTVNDDYNDVDDNQDDTVNDDYNDVDDNQDDTVNGDYNDVDDNQDDTDDTDYDDANNYDDIKVEGNELFEEAEHDYEQLTLFDEEEIDLPLEEEDIFETPNEETIDDSVSEYDQLTLFDDETLDSLEVETTVTETIDTIATESFDAAPEPVVETMSYTSDDSGE